VRPFGNNLREAISGRDMTSFIGVYDVFSASIAAKYYDGLFVSGFGFAASHYGLPDFGFIAWPDMLAFVQRLRTVLPRHHLLVDIDDGYGDPEVACHVVSMLESQGASGVIIEDQQRPRRCGHFEGKQVMALYEFLPKLRAVLHTRKDLFVVARTDAADHDEIVERGVAFARAGADAVLVDGLRDLAPLRVLRRYVKVPLMFNRIAGGKSPQWEIDELRAAGVSLVNHSTPCLFAAQSAVESAMRSMRERDGRAVDFDPPAADVRGCASLLNDNLERRKGGDFARKTAGKARTRPMELA
jgi:2-methylisocitrate lyase-like PEP mutase family enzyme